MIRLGAVVATAGLLVLVLPSTGHAGLPVELPAGSGIHLEPVGEGLPEVLPAEGPQIEANVGVTTDGGIGVEADVAVAGEVGATVEVTADETIGASASAEAGAGAGEVSAAAAVDAMPVETEAAVDVGAGGKPAEPGAPGGTPPAASDGEVPPSAGGPAPGGVISDGPLDPPAVDSRPLPAGADPLHGLSLSAGRSSPGFYTNSHEAPVFDGGAPSAGVRTGGVGGDLRICHYEPAMGRHVLVTLPAGSQALESYLGTEGSFILGSDASCEEIVARSPDPLGEAPDVAGILGNPDGTEFGGYGVLDDLVPTSSAGWLRFSLAVASASAAVAVVAYRRFKPSPLV
ncbi:MAG: hypothetical protein GEU28_08730 [Dehalococcoidia bacterium]|nr:hypothetical protein [Dehalococcoidia bacterium]